MYCTVGLPGSWIDTWLDSHARLGCCYLVSSPLQPVWTNKVNGRRKNKGEGGIRTVRLKWRRMGRIETKKKVIERKRREH